MAVRSLREGEQRPSLLPGRPCCWRALARAAAAFGVFAGLRLLAASGPRGLVFSAGACGRVPSRGHGAASSSARPSCVARRASLAGETVEAEPVGAGSGRAGSEEDRQFARLEDLAREGLVVDAEDVLYDMIDAGVKLSVAHYNAVISACIPKKDVERAERWLFRMQAMETQPSIETYNILIRVAGAAKSAELSETWFEEAQEAAGLQRNLGTYHAFLEARRQVGDVAKMEVWFERMMLAGVTPDIRCCNSVIGAYSDARRMNKVEEWLAIAQHRLQIPLDAESYNLAMAGYIATQDPARAENLMHEMIDRGVKPTARSYALLIGDGTSYRELSVVRHWSKELLEADLELPADTYTAVIGAFSASGDEQNAEEWFSRMVDEGKQTADALALLVDALVLSRGGQGMETAQEWVYQFRSAGHTMAPAVYAALASADVLRGDFEQVEARLQQMEADGLEMDERSLTALLLSYANASPQQSQLAEQMFKLHMLHGKMEATRDVLQALRAAVGGSRCLDLRRELKLTAGPEKPYTPPGRGKRLSEAAMKMVGLRVSAEKQPVLSWE